MSQTILGGTAHKVPDDFKEALFSKSTALKAWGNITPLARNEWICWVISVKQQKTREDHIKRAVKELAEGKRRPCCWIGCIHRTDKKISPSVKSILNKNISSH